MNPQPMEHPHGAMRRKDREITERAEIDAVIHAGKILHLALADNNVPFLVPVCYAYDGKALFFHSAKAGAKIDILKRNPIVCFEITGEHGVIEDESACGFEISHRTVIGFGRAVFVEDEAEKIDALSRIVARFTDKVFVYPPESVVRTAVVRIDVTSLTGKKNQKIEN